MRASIALADSLKAEQDCRGVDAQAFIRSLRDELHAVDQAVALHRAIQASAKPEKPLIGFIVKMHGDDGMKRTTFTRMHWVALTSAVSSAIAGLVSGPWLAGAILLVNSAYVLLQLPTRIHGLPAQVLYEVCLSCNDSTNHEIVLDTLYINLEDSRAREGVTFPQLGRAAFDAAVDALLNDGILRPGESPQSVRLKERVVQGDGDWL